MISNGDFSNGTTGWFLVQNNGGSADMSIDGGELRVKINNAGSDLYSLGVGQNTKNIEKNAIYKITFEAHSDQAIRLASFSQQSFSPWYPYSGIHYLDITTDKKEFSYTFTMREADDQKPLFYFYFGKLVNATIYFDNVTMRKVGSEDALVIPTSFPAPFAPKLKRGMTFGVSLDSPFEGASGTEIRKEYFQMIKDKGFDHIRIPVSWSTHALKSAPYTIDSEFFKRVDWVVGNTLALGMRAVLDIHNFLELENDPAANKACLLSLWQQIATHYRDYPAGLYFEIYNEPCKNMNSIWNQYAADTLQVI
ncbi:MAG TPA: cellulase family glycosylhydrolase, partial [Spirochaetota bacterium]